MITSSLVHFLSTQNWDTHFTFDKQQVLKLNRNNLLFRTLILQKGKLKAALRLVGIIHENIFLCGLHYAEIFFYNEIAL